jgi:SAM-dependent methyltransferase
VSDPADDWDGLSQWWAGGFTDGADMEYVEQVLPMVAQRLPESGLGVDVGCGEGQVTRLMADGGLDAVGIDPFARQIERATDRGGAFARADAVAIPVRDQTAAVVVSVLVIEHVEDMDTAIGEMARVLRPGGRLVLVLNHPLIQTPGSGWIDDFVLDPPEHYWRVGQYLNEVDSVEQVDKGVFVRFHHRPLARYVNAAAANGLVIEEMVEPAPPAGFLDEATDRPGADTIPRLMLLNMRRE